MLWAVEIRPPFYPTAVRNRLRPPKSYIDHSPNCTVIPRTICNNATLKSPSINTSSNQKVKINMFFTPKNHVEKSTRLPAAAASSVHQQMKFSPAETRQLDSWTDVFLHYIPEDVAMEVEGEKQLSELKHKVRGQLMETISGKSILEQLQLIDDIQRLGLAHHFEDEIHEALHPIFQTHSQRHGNDLGLDIHHVSLEFRLLRQHGFYLPSDVFQQFLDESGNFQASLSSDVNGMLSLYEASHLQVHGDNILDKALKFTTAQLKSMKNTLAEPLAAKVAHSLDQPLYKGIAFLESRYYISFYERNPGHCEILLKFAKLNYNSIQSLYRKEIIEVTRWTYNHMEVYTGLPYNVRELIVQTYYCAFAAYDGHPHYSMGRKMYYKMVLIGTMFDDLYDACDIGDLQLLTKALERLGRQRTNELPDKLKLAYTKVLDTFDEVEQELAKEGRSHGFCHLLNSFEIIWEYHLETSKWSREKYVPMFDEFMIPAVVNAGLLFFIFLGSIGKEQTPVQDTYEWTEENPGVVRALGIHFRLQVDLAEDDPMQRSATHEHSAIACYMKQHNLTNKAQVYEQLQAFIEHAWKDINDAMLRRTSATPMQVLHSVLNQARLLHVLYKKGDGYTLAHKTPMQEILALLFKDPIPM